MDSMYDTVGGAERVRALVDAFYDAMDTLEETRRIRALHADDLTESREKLYQFLSGWMGGPNLYVEKHGHPRLRARHMPFPISTEDARQWLLCMEVALNDTVEDPAVRQQLMQSFQRVAAHMRNRPD